MKKLTRFLLLIFTISLASCQSEELFDDQMTDIIAKNPKDGIFRIYPTGSTTRSANTIYIDLEPANRLVYYNFQSDRYTPQQIQANFKVEFFVGENFDWLSRAFNTIENFPRTNANGQLYYLGEQDGDYFPLRGFGYQAEYSINAVTSVRWCLNMYKVNDEGQSNFYYTYLFPIRIKLTHKWGGPSFTYDIIQSCGYFGGGGEFNWQFSIP